MATEPEFLKLTDDQLAQVEKFLKLFRNTNWRLTSFQLEMISSNMPNQS